MYFNVFQIVIFIIGFIFFLVSIDFFKAKKFTFAHFLIVGGGSVIMALSFLYPGFLDDISHRIGLARGADMVVYFGLIMLIWMFLGLYNRQIKTDISVTNLMRNMSLEQARGSISDETETVIVMPTYHQDKKVIILIKDILQLGHGVIWVDDGKNNDLYRHIASSFKKDECVIIRHQQNMGQGAALQTGNKYAKEYTKAKYIIHFDSDGQHQTKDIKSFIHMAEKHSKTDIVFGSRFLPGAKKIPLKRHRIKKGHLLFTRLFVGTKLTDTNNGFRLIRRGALDHLVITLNDYSHASEIESLVVKNNLKYHEVPVDIIYGINPNGQSLWNAIDIAKKILYRNLFFK